MEKIKIQICAGTTCYVMGAGEILEQRNKITERFPDRCKIEAVNCMDLCKQGKYGQAPFAKVGDTVIPEANVNKIIEQVRKQL